MDDRGRTGPALPVALLALVLGAGADQAFADLTLFAGRSTATAGPTGGAALGMSLRPVGVEFEYAGMSTDEAGQPAVQTGLFNLLVSTPFGAGDRIQVYGSVGGGLYRERFDGHSRTDMAASAGGGVNLVLIGPFRLRIDYRLLVLRGEPPHRRTRRAYAGLNVGF